MQRLRTVSLAAVIAATGVVAAACGSGGSGYGQPASRSATSAPRPTGTATTVTVSSSPLGQVLVDGSGRTLYLFRADTSTVSTCYDACADAFQWPSRKSIDRGWWMATQRWVAVPYRWRNCLPNSWPCGRRSVR